MNWIKTNDRGDLVTACGRWIARREFGGGLWRVVYYAGGEVVGIGDNADEALDDWAYRARRLSNDLLDLAECVEQAREFSEDD